MRWLVLFFPKHQANSNLLDMLKAMEHGDWKANKEGVAIVPAGEERNNHFNGDIVNQVASESGKWKLEETRFDQGGSVGLHGKNGAMMPRL